MTKKDLASGENNYKNINQTETDKRKASEEESLEKTIISEEKTMAENSNNDVFLEKDEFSAKLDYDELYKIWYSQDFDSLKSNYGINNPREQIIYCLEGLRKLHSEGLVASLEGLPEKEYLMRESLNSLSYVRYDVGPRFFPDERTFFEEEIDNQKYDNRLEKGWVQGGIAGISNYAYWTIAQYLVDNTFEPSNKERLLGSLIIGLVFAGSAFYQKRSLGDSISDFITK